MATAAAATATTATTIFAAVTASANTASAPASAITASTIAPASTTASATAAAAAATISTPPSATATAAVNSTSSGDCHPTALPLSSGPAGIPEDSHSLSAPSTSLSAPSTSLPAYTACVDPNFSWGSQDGEAFTETITSLYSEVVHWRRNLFKVPSGKTGNLFVKELSRLLAAYVDDSALSSVALFAAMVFPALVLQKPSKKSKSKEHTRLLERRMSLWREGRLSELLHEGRTIQCRLRSSQLNNSNEYYVKKHFSKLMWEGKVKAALQLLSDKPAKGLLSLDQTVPGSDGSVVTVLEALKSKHPSASPVHPEVLCSRSTATLDSHPVLFERIDGPLVRSVVLKMDGAAGPSGLDTAIWKRLCTSFKRFSADLCDILASLARKLCTEYLDPEGLAPLVACRLVALDKCPGVRPIGIGECVRRIIGRTISSVLSTDIQESAGALQLCAGHEGGCEAAVHALRHIFSSTETDAILSVDAANAFNSLNREVALRNVMQVCPPLATALINTYRSSIDLYINGETISSLEGTTQGDPLAMAMYAIATVPMIQKIANDGVQQVWYADDAAAGGKLGSIRKWWDAIQTYGPKYGYFPNPTKTRLVVKDEQLSEATTLFQDTGITVTNTGTRYLGAAIGTPAFVKSFVDEKVKCWVEEIVLLSKIAADEPQTAYTAFTFGVRSRWNYLSRTVPEIESSLQPLEDSIRREFLPALTGQAAFGDAVRNLLALPTRAGGLGISNPVLQATPQHQTSIKVTHPLVKLILSQTSDFSYETVVELLEVKRELRRVKKEELTLAVGTVSNDLSESLKRSVELASEKGASSWLSTLPIQEHGFCLHKGAFRDALCLRYGWKPPRLPTHCVCAKPFSVDHALSCSYGGFPSVRHNEIRDLTAHLMSEVCHNVGIEPELQPLTGERFDLRSANVEDGARLDVRAESFWGRDRQCAFFDVRVFNPLAHTYRNIPLTSSYRRNEQEKRRRYDQRVREVEHGSFSPLVFSATGGMGPTAKVVYKKLASMIATKHDKPYSQTINWLRCRLCFSLLRSAVMCLRGSRSSQGHPAKPIISEASIELALSEGHVQ